MKTLNIAMLSVTIAVASLLAYPSTALVNVQTCIISPNTQFQLNADYATYAFPELAQKYWPDLNVSHVKVIGDYFDATNYDVARSYMKGNGGAICDLIIGPGYSDGCIAISPLIGKPLWIDYASTSTQLSSKTQFPNFLRVVSTDAQGGMVIAQLLKTFNWKNIFVMKSDDVYGTTYAAGVSTAHTRNGGQILRTFNLLKDSWTLELFIATLSDVKSQLVSSRVVVVAGIQVALLIRAVRALKLESEITFIFSDQACSGSSTWAQLPGAFCVTMDLEPTRWSNFTTRYRARSDAEFNRSADELFAARYTRRGVVNARNSVSSFTALSVDAIFYGLTVLQQYQSTRNGSLPLDSVAAAKYAIASNITFPEGMTGPLGVDANGDRKIFISAVYNSDTKNISQIVARDYGDGMLISFTKPFNILTQEFALEGRTAAEIQAEIPADRVIVPIVKSNALPSYAFALIAVAAAVVFGATAVILYVLYAYMRRGELTKYAPKSEAEPAAIIFTDIESSTALWAECPQQMALALELHNKIIRKCISLHRGYEVKTIGDSFMIAFCSAQDAVEFSLQMQKDLFEAVWNESGDGYSSGRINNFYEEQHLADLTESPANMWNGLRVRVGGHMGFVSIKRVVQNNADGSAASVDVGTPYDYFGSPVNVAARIESIGHGGQILFSKALLEACDAENNNLPFLRKPLGNVDLRGYNEPVQVFQVYATDFEKRTFRALRLQKADVEFDNSVSDTQSQSAPTGKHSASIATADMNAMISAFCAKRKLREEDVKQGFVAIDSLMSVLTGSEQRKQLSGLIKAWHIRDDAVEANKKNDLFMKLLLASRLGPVINVRELKLFGHTLGKKKSLRSGTHSKDYEESDHMSLIEEITKK